MEVKCFKKEVLNYPISVQLSKSGADWLVKIFGGCTPHIGSTSVAYWVQDRVEVKTILLPTHRDDVVSEQFAKTLSTYSHSTVTVVCGIHYENPDKQELAQIVSCTQELLDEILNSIF